MRARKRACLAQIRVPFHRQKSQKTFPLNPKNNLDTPGKPTRSLMLMDLAAAGAFLMPMSPPPDSEFWITDFWDPGGGGIEIAVSFDL